MADEHLNGNAGAGPQSRSGVAAAPKDPRNAIIDALLELAGERIWEDITISDVAARANVSLSTFRDIFPSKGAVLAAFSRRIDHIVRDAAGDGLIGEPVKERLFDVLMRRLDALAPYKLGLEAISDWTRRDPLARSEEHTSELQSLAHLVCRLLLEKKTELRAHNAIVSQETRRKSAESCTSWT